MIINRIEPLAMIDEESFLPLYYDMECKHKPITADNGEIVCCLCGIVFGQDYYYNDEDNNVFYDKHGRTNPWLLGLGSVIPKSWYAEIAKTQKVDGQEYSRLANLAEYLNLHLYMKDLEYRFKRYYRNKNDEVLAAEIALLVLIKDYDITIDKERIEDAINTIYHDEINKLPNDLTLIANLATVYGASLSYSMMRRKGGYL